MGCGKGQDDSRCACLSSMTGISAAYEGYDDAFAAEVLVLGCWG